jgi:PhnB protein
MTMTLTKQVQPYLFLDGRCEEAIDFYVRALGAEVTGLLRYKDSPDPSMTMPGAADKVMHSSFRIGETTVMASDGRCEGRPTFQGFALSLTVPDETEAARRFSALADGGRVEMPLTKTFFSPSFGMVADRFGVFWMVHVMPEARSEAVARRFEAKSAEAAETLQRLTDADWRKVTAAERWSVGVTAHHLAGALEPISRMIAALAAGESLERFGLASIDEMNARHAKEHAACTRTETIELHRRGATMAAATIRRLTDEQLAVKGTVVAGAPPMSVEELITRALLHHIDEHYGSIRKTIDR